jgi:glycine/D-amino acid oxidase-like deaminating enzyme
MLMRPYFDAMTRVSDLGLWKTTAPGAPSLEALEGKRATDVAVIGAGYTGLSTALHLAEAGISVTVLEARQIGHGGSGRNVGLVNAGLWMFPDDVVKIMGPDDGERLLTFLGKSPDLVFGLIEKHNIRCEAVRSGTLHCAHSPAGFRALQLREQQWGRRGAPVTLLDKEQAAPKIGSHSFYGALMDLRAGTLQPLAYAHGLAHAAVKAGAGMYHSSPVQTLTRRQGRWHLKTPAGVLNARAVIVATGGYTDHFDPALKQTFIPFNYFQFSTPPLPDAVRRTILPDGHGAWDTNLVLSSYRMDSQGRLVVGSVGQVDRFALGLHRQWTRRTLAKVFPQIGPVEFEHAWHGRIAMTTNCIPRFFKLGPDLAMVTHYNGRGIGPGTVFGKLLAEYVRTGAESIIPLPVSKTRPIFLRNLRGLFYETGARLYHFFQRRV